VASTDIDAILAKPASPELLAAAESALARPALTPEQAIDAGVRFVCDERLGGP
jgi:hypothetical protein